MGSKKRIYIRTYTAVTQSIDMKALANRDKGEVVQYPYIQRDAYRYRILCQINGWEIIIIDIIGHSESLFLRRG